MNEPIEISYDDIEEARRDEALQEREERLDPFERCCNYYEGEVKRINFDVLADVIIDLDNVETQYQIEKAFRDVQTIALHQLLMEQTKKVLWARACHKYEIEHIETERPDWGKL